MVRSLLWMVPLALAVALLGAVARRVPTVVAAAAVTDSTLAHVSRGEPVPDSVGFAISDETERAAMTAGVLEPEGAREARFKTALRAGPVRRERSGAWATAFAQATQWPPSDQIPTMTFVTLADGRQFFLFAEHLDGRWYVHGAQVQP